MKLPITPILSFAFALVAPFAAESPITVCTANAQEHTAPGDPYCIDALIKEMAQKHRVPAEFVKSIVAAESNFNSDAVSPKGAIGLMQLMPDTAREWGADPKDPQQNIEAGTRYLQFLIERYHKRPKALLCAIAAYNAGPAVVDRYHGVPPFRETRGYVARVLSFLRRFRREALQKPGGAGE